MTLMLEEECEAMTVGELKKILSLVPDDYEVRLQQHGGTTLELIGMGGFSGPSQWVGLQIAERELTETSNADA